MGHDLATNSNSKGLQKNEQCRCPVMSVGQAMEKEEREVKRVPSVEGGWGCGQDLGRILDGTARMGC